MTYDLKLQRLPPLRGPALHAAARLVNARVVGPVLRRGLALGAGLSHLHRQPVSDAPRTGPVLPLHAEWDAPEQSEDLAHLLAVRDDPRDHRLTIGDFVDAYRRGVTTPLAVAERVLAEIARSDAASPPLRAMISRDREDVLKQARASAERHARGESLGPLDGVPVAVKDEVDVAGYPTQVGLDLPGTPPAERDAASVARLRAAGAILLGKANMHELGAGATGLNTRHGTARNPHDPERHTGGSSSGSAAAVAAGLCPLAVGVDSGGSIRIPAALCGITGLKATWGRISRSGAAPLTTTLQHIGPLGSTVRDVAVGLAVMSGRDPGDPSSLVQPPLRLADATREGVKGRVLGVFEPYFRDADPAVVRACEEAMGHLERAGARRRSIVIRDLELHRVTHLTTLASEALGFLHQHGDSLPLSPDTRIGLSLAHALGPRDWIQAQRHRARLCRELLGVFEEVDAVVTPTVPLTAPRVHPGALTHGEGDTTTLQRLLWFTIPANVVGLPAISVPAGWDAQGLPVGIQFMGRPWEEDVLLALGMAVEHAVPSRRPLRWYPVLG